MVARSKKRSTFSGKVVTIRSLPPFRVELLVEFLSFFLFFLLSSLPACLPASLSF
jgi:hypothetical protein